MKVTELEIPDIPRLTELHDYNNADEMVSRYTDEVQTDKIAIFVLLDGTTLVGEIQVKYQCDDANYAVRGKRAYLYAFRIREEYQDKGYGKYLLKSVLDILRKKGYLEFTIGVEDDNLKAQHIYHLFGFDEFILRAEDEYQGDTYEYNLYLAR